MATATCLPSNEAVSGVLCQLRRARTTLDSHHLQMKRTIPQMAGSASKPGEAYTLLQQVHPAPFPNDHAIVFGAELVLQSRFSGDAQYQTLWWL